LAGAIAADDAMRNRVAAHGDLLLPLERLGGVLGGLVHGRRHFVGLAIADCHSAALVADDDEGVEAETTAALDDGGTAPNLDDAVFQFVAALVPVSIPISISIACHGCPAFVFGEPGAEATGVSFSEDTPVAYASG